MQVSRSAYYQSLEMREPKPENRQVEVQVVEVFKEHRRRYGIRRICSELKYRGTRIGKYKCRRVMRQHGLKAIQPRSFVPRTTDRRHPYPISPNLLLERQPPQNRMKRGWGILPTSRSQKAGGRICRYGWISSDICA
jgi:hypothetical protein